MCIYAGVDRALEVSQGSPYWCTSRDAMPVSARLSRQDTRWYTLRKQVQGEAGALQTGACTHRVACYVGYAWQHSHCMLVIGSICSAYISKCLVMAPNHAQDTQFHAFSTWIDVTCQENVLPASALELGVIKTENSHWTYISVFHWLEEVLKKPQLAAFWGVITHLSKPHSMDTT